MTALANRQLATNNYAKDLKEKLSEVEAKRKALRDKLAKTEHRLKGTEAALEEAWDEAKGERAVAAILQMSLDEMRSQQEAVVAYIQSKAFNDEVMEYFISGFKTPHRRALRIFPDLNLSMLRADAELTSVEQEPNKKIVVD